MPNVGMTGRWPGFLAPLVVLLGTLMLTWLMSVVVGDADGSEPVPGLVLLILLVSPFAVAIGWGGALLAGRPHRLAPVAAIIWLIVSWIAVPHDYVWQLLGYVAAGLLSGMALGMRWRLDVALLVMALALSPILVWTAMEVPVAEQMQIISDDTLEILEQSLPVSADKTQRAAALATEQRRLDQAIALLTRLYPFALAVGVLGQAGIILSLLWALAKVLGLAPPRWNLPPFSRWRVPFYVVWALVVGLGLIVTRQPQLKHIGLNLALLAACILSVQGMAVQFFVTGRIMSPVGRVVFWTVMGVFFSLVAVASGVALGLVDQWWDIRRLAADKQEIEHQDDAEQDDDDNDESDDDLSDDDLGET